MAIALELRTLSEVAFGLSATELDCRVPGLQVLGSVFIVSPFNSKKLEWHAKKVCKQGRDDVKVTVVYKLSLIHPYIFFLHHCMCSVYRAKKM